jgi:hypothetical protein
VAWRRALGLGLRDHGFVVHYHPHSTDLVCAFPLTVVSQHTRLRRDGFKHKRGVGRAYMALKSNQSVIGVDRQACRMARNRRGRQSQKGSAI